MTEIIKAYYQEHKSVFGENFQMVLENFDVEAIHKMRTSTKRLRALFILLEFLSEKKFKARKQLKKIRYLFKFVGNIRELQIEQQLILQYQLVRDQDYGSYIDYLKQRENREIARFLKHLPPQTTIESFLNDEEINSSIGQLVDETVKKRAFDFLKLKEKKIKTLIAQPASNHRIHTNRTHLKQLYYLFEILSFLTENDSVLGLSNERIREMEQHFGEWHDLVNSPLFMNSFFKTQNFKGEEKYFALKKEIADKRKTMRKEITASLYPEIIC